MHRDSAARLDADAEEQRAVRADMARLRRDYEDRSPRLFLLLDSGGCGVFRTVQTVLDCFAPSAEEFASRTR